MNETKRTLIYVGVAVGLLLLAFIFAPKRITPDQFQDQGTAFYPDFTDPNEATTMEVVEFDSTTGSPHAFKVTFENGRWTIPSHHNYPADAKDRLAKTAAGIMLIKRDDYRSDNVADYESFGVVDPLDETAGLIGRGKRVTIKGPGGKVLSDLIIGKEVEGRPNLRFVRAPDEKRVYAARVDVDISTNFEDWIDTDLLQLSKNNINKVVLNDYSINERTRSVDRRDHVELYRKDGVWKAKKMKANQQVDSTAMNELLTTLDSLKIVGVRPKPAGLSASLKKDESASDVSQQDVLSLQAKGFYFTRDGQLLSNEGEMNVYSNDGVVYTLRFGEVVYGSGLAVSAGTDANNTKSNGAAQNRFLFVTTTFDGSAFKEPPAPKNKDFLKKPDSLWTDQDKENKRIYEQHSAWASKVSKGKQKSKELNARYADWYYVISDDSFQKLHRSRSKLIVKKEK